LILAIAIIGFIGRGSVTIGPFEVPEVAKVIFAIGVGYIPRFARVTRSGMLAEAKEDYVLAAKSIGKPSIKIIYQDILPNIIPPILVQASLRTATAIIIAAGMSFLGLGVSPPTPSLGLMLANAKNYVMIGVWWLPVFPGLAIMVLCLGLNLLGDGLRNIIDPTHREVVSVPGSKR
jgi:ABC-type dipeptide/oligopeptide/nickel transport system permease subunit